MCIVPPNFTPPLHKSSQLLLSTGTQISGPWWSKHIYNKFGISLETVLSFLLEATKTYECAAVSEVDLYISPYSPGWLALFSQLAKVMRICWLSRHVV